MKLLHYTYRKLSLWLLVLMAVWGVLFYYTIMYELMDETDDTLENYAQIIINNALYDESVLNTEGNLMSFYYFHPLSVKEGENYRDIHWSMKKAKKNTSQCAYTAPPSVCPTGNSMSWN